MAVQELHFGVQWKACLHTESGESLLVEWPKQVVDVLPREPALGWRHEV